MSLWRIYTNLSPRARLGLGVGLLAWGVVGMYISDRAEERFGFTPTDEDRDALDRVTPKIHAVDRDDSRRL